jgi:uncharacterized protein
MVKCANCGEENRDGLIFCSNCGARLDSTAIDQNVKRCSFCSKPLVGEDTYYFHCRYCGQDFCSEHRLPENHLCKSHPMSRTLPSTSSPYYSTGGGYSTPTYRRRTSFGLNISKPGRNLIILILLGLLIGFIAQFFFVDNIQVLIFLLQDNYLVYHGWIPPIVTSMIVAVPDLNGLEDVFFNAISVLFIDGLFRSAFTQKQYYLVFLVTGIIGNILSLVGYGPGNGIVSPTTVISFGASGGIFGLLAGAISTDYIVNRRVNTTLLIWFIFVFIISTASIGVDAYAHIGGTLSGLVAGFFIGRRRSKTRTYF